MSSRRDEKDRRRQERLAHEAAERRRARRGRRLRLAAAGAVLMAVVAAGVVIAAGGGGGGGSAAGSGGSAVLASVDGEAGGATVDGIRCQAAEQVLFHVHAHLAVYVDGRQQTIPEGIGIAAPRSVQQTSQGPFVSGGSCFYWLHSHAQDGVIHIESPVRRTFTLGNYFDIWRQPLGARQVGPAHGPVTAFVDGRRAAGDPRAIPLKAHELIQLDVGAPATAPRPYVFAPGL